MPKLLFTFASCLLHRYIRDVPGTGLSPKSYTLRVVTSVPHTAQRAALRGVFKIPEKEVCSVTIINKRAEVKGDQAIVEFVGSNSVKDFQCRTDNCHRVPCEGKLMHTCMYMHVHVHEQ